MRYWLYSLVMCVTFLLASQIAAAQTVIYQDDFEGTVTGWSLNNTDFDPDVTRFLGRFDNNPKQTSRTFTIPANTASVDIDFDFYRFDSWDDSQQYGYDRFEVIIDGVEIFSLPFPNPQAARSGTTGNVDWAHSPLTPTVELAFGTGTYWFDQLHRVNITVNNPGAALALTLRADINQGGNDESGGFDNIIITAFSNSVPPNLTAQKTVEMVGMSYSLPGNIAEYTIAVQNTGGEVDANSLSFTDTLPSNVSLFTGDLDGSGNPVIFNDSSTPISGVSCCTAAQIEFSNSAAAPPVFGYVPVSMYDSNITFLRVTPSGAVRDSQTDPVNLDFQFRARID